MSLVIDRLIIRESGCVGWHGAVDGRGYPHFSSGGKTYRVFRYLYQQFRGPIPDGHQLHHECRDKTCVNPWHMRPVTRREHYVDIHNSMAKARASKKPKTHCKHGHELAGENVQIVNGYRRCVSCVKEHERNRNQHRECPLCGGPMDRGASRCRSCWRRSL